VLCADILQEQEAAEAQALLEQKMEEARLREEESRRLQEELESARLLMEENQRALEEARNAPPQIITVTVPVVQAEPEVNYRATDDAVDNTYDSYAETRETYEAAPPTVSLMSFASNSVEDEADDHVSEPEPAEQSINYYYY
jgi:hypothetical protein